MVWKWCRPLIAVPLPENAVLPVSALKPCSSLSPSAPTAQTIGLALPSVVVRMGAPAPFICAHQAKLTGDEPPAATFSTVIFSPEQWLLLGLANATMVAVSV